jgi:DNA-binding transcriptional ArsR family regulator
MWYGEPVSITPRRVTGDARRWKAMSHPLRREILRHLGEHQAATSTTIAEALGENTGTTSYHLRVLADAGVIEDIPERAHGRERWWRVIPVDLREPDYDTLSATERAALDEWRAGQIPGELDLVNRFIRDYRQHGNWAKASRAGGYYTAEDLDALFEDYTALLQKYGHTAQDAPPGARPMQLRMFYIPDEPGQPE